MSDQGPTYDDCKAALAKISPDLLGVVPQVSGTGIQGTDPTAYRIVVYVKKGSKTLLEQKGIIPSTVNVGDPKESVAVPVSIEEHEDFAF